MTEKDYSLLGQTMDEFKTVKQKIAVLRKKASDIGRQLEGIGHYLTHNPESLWFEGDSIENEFVETHEIGYGGPKRYSKLSLNAPELLQLLSDLRACYKEEDRLAESLEGMGHPQTRTNRRAAA